MREFKIYTINDNEFRVHHITIEEILTRLNKIDNDINEIKEVLRQIEKRLENKRI